MVSEVKSTEVRKEIEITWTIKSATNEIYYIMQTVNTMGGNDFELPALYGLIELVKNGEITPENGVSQAKTIEGRKNSNYH